LSRSLRDDLQDFFTERERIVSSPASRRELLTWLSVAEAAAHRGAYLLETWRAKFSVKEKGRADLVTDADFASQVAVRSHLLDCFPDHGFIGEEDTHGFPKGKLPHPDPNVPTWIVDPLDGTANYVHDAPCYCVSIGLMLGGKPILGVIYDPRADEMFSGAHGLGATLNGATMQVSTVSDVSQALLSTGFPPDLEAQERNLHWWRILSVEGQALRRTGSTALNLAYTAAGRYDGYWAFDNYPWDVVGGLALIIEAGGKASNVDGSTLDPFRADVLATNGLIQDQLLSILARV
jgi:myo-inositol-1(or 4)-monophosphatase